MKRARCVERRRGARWRGDKRRQKRLSVGGSSRLLSSGSERRTDANLPSATVNSPAPSQAALEPELEHTPSLLSKTDVGISHFHHFHFLISLYGILLPLFRSVCRWLRRGLSFLSCSCVFSSSLPPYCAAHTYIKLQWLKQKILPLFRPKIDGRPCH